MNVLIGCDPEVFVKRKGEFISAHGLVSGDKLKPTPVEKGAIQVDGMALEFNIVPAENANDFLINIKTVMKILEQTAKHRLQIVPVADFSQEVIDNSPPEALELGCDPDFNGWTKERNPRPDGTRNFRTASGHIHIGWGEDIPESSEHYEECCKVAKQCDFYLGLPSLFWDKDTRRRSMYGKAGCFRPKPYGIEYRTLSNMWLKKDKLIQFVFNAAKSAYIDLQNGLYLPDIFGDIQPIINNSDRKAAKAIMSEMEDKLGMEWDYA